MERSSPIAANNTTMAEPPCETSGSGTPVTGRSESTTPMLIIAWPQIQTTIPSASRAPNVSGAFREMPMPRSAISRKAINTPAAPTSPSSCPMTAKM